MDKQRSVGKNLGVMRNQYSRYKQEQDLRRREWQCFILKLVTNSYSAKSSRQAFGEQVRASM